MRRFLVLLALWLAAPAAWAAPVHVSYWEKWTGFEKDAMQAVVDDFNHSQSEVWVDYLSISGVNQKTLIATAAGNPPDLAGVWAADIVDFADKGALLPLDDALARSSIREERYLPVYWQMGTASVVEADGHAATHMYALVSAPSVLALHWNKTLFARAGLDPEKPPRTLAELDADAKLLTHRAGTDISQIGFLPTEPGWWPYGWGYWFGGRPWDGGNRILIDSPENRRAYHWLRGYAESYGVQALQNLSSSFGNYASAQNPFLSGKLAMVLQGVWLGDFIARYAPDLSWGAAPFPSESADGAPVTLADADMLAIPRGARHPAEAFRFMEFLSQEVETEKVCLGQGKNSPLKEVSEAFFEHHKNPHIRMFQTLARSPAAAAVPKLPIWHEYVSEESNALSRTWLLEATPERALRDAQARVQASWDRERQRAKSKPSRWPSLAPLVLTGLLVLGVIAFALRQARAWRALRGGAKAARANASLLKGLLFSSPWLLGGALFVAFPVASAFVYAFCDYSVLSPPRYVGLANFEELIADDTFWLALKNTATYVAFSLPLGLISALCLALLLDTRVRGSTVYRTLLFLPALLPTVANAMVWLWILNGEYGILNRALSVVTFGHWGNNVSWLGDQRLAMPSLIVMSAWGVGQTVVTFATALEGVPGSLYEAAELDGAGLWRKIRHISLPSIAPVLFFNVVMGVSGGLQVFIQPYVMTGGGPARATLSYAMRLYENGFEYLRMGYACAMACVLCALIVTLTAAAHLLGKRHGLSASH